MRSFLISILSTIKGYFRQKKIFYTHINCHFYTNAERGTICKIYSVNINIAKIDITAYKMDSGVIKYTIMALLKIVLSY